MTTCDEEARLEALYQRKLLDTPPSENFDRITRLASRLFGLPIAAVSLTDRDRQWFKSRVGVSHMTIPRDRAPCAQVAETGAVLVVSDFDANPFYRTSPLGLSGIRFYAGAPLQTRDGHTLGALCVLGTEPREVTEGELAALQDLSKMVMEQIELQHALGRTDHLTGLPNRSQFADDLADLAHDHAGVSRIAVMVDLGRSQQLEDVARVMGAVHVEGLVQEAAVILRRMLGPHRPIYHVADTRFAFLAPSKGGLEDYVLQLEDGLDKTRVARSLAMGVRTVAGVVPFVLGQMSPDEILRALRAASEEAHSSESAVSVFSPGNDAGHQRRFQILRDFPAALAATNQLRMVFQPRVDLQAGGCHGAEALIRWEHPELGAISPAEFVPIVERSSHAGAMTRFVLNESLQRLASWTERGLDLSLSINVSAVNLAEADFAGEVAQALLRYRVTPERLELEITESAIMSDTVRALEHLNALAAMGIRLAIDDFGTGHSSLAYLQRLPAQIVKIDQSFVFDLERGQREQALVRSMVNLAHELDYRVVAEGVETEAAADLLRAFGCSEAQGYLFARPLEAGDFERWLRDRADARRLRRAVG